MMCCRCIVCHACLCKQWYVFETTLNVGGADTCLASAGGAPPPSGRAGERVGGPPGARTGPLAGRRVVGRPAGALETR